MNTYGCFVDYSKAFDYLRGKKMWKHLEKMGASKHLVALLENLNIENLAKVREHGELSKSFKVDKGVKHG